MILTQKNKDSGISIVFMLVILSYTFSVLWGWFPLTHSIIPLIIGWVAGLYICSEFFTTRSFAYFFIYSVVLFINAISGDHLFPTTRSAFIEITWILLPAVFLFGFLRKGNEKISNATVVMVLIIIICNAIGSSFIEMVVPGSIRALNAETRLTGDPTLQNYYFRFGLANYALPHALTMVIPLLIMGLKLPIEKKRKTFLLVSLIACLVLVYLSGATGALFTAIFALIISVVTNKKTGAGRLFLFFAGGVALMYVLGNDKLLLSMLDWFDGITGGDGHFHNKVMEFETLVVYGETTGDIEERGSLYTTTLDAITQHPLIGVNEATGGHSALFDRWACLGLVGFLPFVLFIISQIKQSINVIKKQSVVFYMESILVAFIMLAMKAVDRWEMWLFLFTVLPLLTRYIENGQKREAIAA